MKRTLAMMERYNVVGVASGPIEVVRRWHTAAPDRIIPALVSAGEVPLDSIRAWAADSTIRVLGELMFQYRGLGPTDSVPEAYYALAEQLDLPVGVHVGLGPPGQPTWRLRATGQRSVTRCCSRRRCSAIRN
jgi:predicted TIM-barrel fold metal-dependent hydrolase